MNVHGVVYLSYHAYGTVRVQMFNNTNAAMLWLRGCKGALIEMRLITFSRPDGIVLAEAK